MDALVAILAGLLGLAIGSFLNVVIWRVPRNESVVTPPSACPRCGHVIRNRDNVPVLGWLLLRGKCRDCQLPISARYPAVEAATGVLFALMALRIGLEPELPAFLYVTAVGIALALIDLDTMRLPDKLTLPSIAVTAALLIGAAAFDDQWDALVRAGVGAAALGAFYFTLWFVKPGGMGFGDVKLAPTLGACLGWVSYGALGVGAFTGFVYGGIVGVIIILRGKGGRKTKVPFGPFMILGMFTGVLVGQQLADAYVSVTLG